MRDDEILEWEKMTQGIILSTRHVDKRVRACVVGNGGKRDQVKMKPDRNRLIMLAVHVPLTPLSLPNSNLFILLGSVPGTFQMIPLHRLCICWSPALESSPNLIHGKLLALSDVTIPCIRYHSMNHSWKLSL